MAIVFLQKQKKQKYLLFGLVAVIIILPLIIIAVRKSQESGVEAPVTIETPEKVEINYAILKNADLGSFEVFESTPQVEEGISGRDNPFSFAEEAE